MPALRYSEDTELNDALRARGIIPPLPKVESPPSSPLRSNHDQAKDRLSSLLDKASTTDAVLKLELDELDLDDELPTDLMEAWRDARLEELSGAEAVRRQASFGPGVRPIGREDYVREVNRASEKNLPDYDPNEESGRRAGTGVVLCLWNNSPHSQHLLTLLDRLSFLYPTTHCLSIAGRSCIDNYPDANQPTLLCYRRGQCVRQYVGIENTQGTRFKGLETELEDLEAELRSIGMLDEDLKDQRAFGPSQVVSKKEDEDEDESDDSESAQNSGRGSRKTKNVRNGFSSRSQSQRNDDDSDLDI